MEIRKSVSIPFLAKMQKHKASRPEAAANALMHNEIKSINLFKFLLQRVHEPTTFLIYN